MLFYRKHDFYLLMFRCLQSVFPVREPNRVKQSRWTRHGQLTGVAHFVDRLTGIFTTYITTLVHYSKIALLCFSAFTSKEIMPKD